METTPGFIQTPPPPPPPQRSRKGLWIGLGIGAILLCLCCVVVVVVVYFYGRNIPYVSSLFPTPTPTGLFYTNPSAGISLTYPVTWQYSEQGDAATGYTIILASSAEILNASSDAPLDGAAIAILTNLLTPSDLTFTPDASTMGDVVDYIATTYFTNLSQGQDLRTFSMSGYPAASGLYSMTNTNGGPSAAYVVAVLRSSEIILIFSVCPQPDWSLYKPTFNEIINSVVIVTP